MLLNTHPQITMKSSRSILSLNWRLQLLMIMDTNNWSYALIDNNHASRKYALPTSRWIEMAIQHSLELASESCIDDGHTIRTGINLIFWTNSSFYLNPLHLSPYIFFYIEIFLVLNRVSPRHRMEWHCSYSNSCYWIRCPLSCVEHCTIRVDFRTFCLAVVCTCHLCFLISYPIVIGLPTL